MHEKNLNIVKGMTQFKTYQLCISKIFFNCQHPLSEKRIQKMDMEKPNHKTYNEINCILMNKGDETKKIIVLSLQ